MGTFPGLERLTRISSAAMLRINAQKREELNNTEISIRYLRRIRSLLVRNAHSLTDHPHTPAANADIWLVKIISWGRPSVQVVESLCFISTSVTAVPVYGPILCLQLSDSLLLTRADAAIQQGRIFNRYHLLSDSQSGGR